jgi:hypothetical protein
VRGASPVVVFFVHASSVTTVVLPFPHNHRTTGSHLLPIFPPCLKPPPAPCKTLASLPFLCRHPGSFLLFFLYVHVKELSTPTSPCHGIAATDHPSSSRDHQQMRLVVPVTRLQGIGPGPLQSTRNSPFPSPTCNLPVKIPVASIHLRPCRPLPWHHGEHAHLPSLSSLSISLCV